MPETFHLFSRLPRELRQMIWTFVPRPRVPGVHIFGTEHGNNYCDGDMAPCDDFIRPLDCGPRRQQLTPPTPRFPPTTSTLAEPSWTKSNPSSYLVDGGLWTACKESRAVMEREYEVEHWRTLKHSGDYPRDRTRMPSMGGFLDNGSPHYFTIFPNQDLFYFQANGLERRMISGHDIPDDHRLWSTRNGFHGPKHVAIEYNPEWWSSVQEDELMDQPFVEILDDFSAAVIASTINIIWFVDYSLKRQRPSSTDRKRVIFEGADRRFVEVVGCHIDAEQMYDEFETDSGSLEFFKAVEEAATEYEDYPSVVDVSRCYGRAQFGILACEFF
ncbi:hypothetical protein LCI18_003626 [Fusarium solani-melongenae]|uniref:Uncharacterized protein n=1 Tax=Fusarium solani subsp. cucurbitae TaxID=2747967 RepID=A0ACD3YVQ7_FUSSC|nr:hypothetical protein LCI18_003626 [Fusarium solani-melongenae]